MTTSSEDRARFRRMIAKSKLPISVFSEWVLGRDPATGFRYLSDGEIPRSTLEWLRRVQSVEQRGDEIHIVLRWGFANPRWWPFVEHGERRTFMTDERHVEERHKRAM